MKGVPEEELRLGEMKARAREGYVKREDGDGTYWIPEPPEGEDDCPRCGGIHDHEEMKIRQMDQPLRDEQGTWAHYWMCPDGGGPILILYDRDPEAEFPPKEELGEGSE